MALTAIVFAIAFVVVQFSAVAYSPRVVLRFVKDRALFHTLGIFMASFIYSLWTLVWIDRAGSGTVPLFSVLLVAFLIILSMVLFSHLVERLNDLQITSVLHSIGDSGREVIDKMFAPLDGCPRVEGGTDKRFDWKALGPPSKRLTYVGPPRTVASFDVKRLVRLAQEADCVIKMACAVGDTLVEGELLLEVHGSDRKLPDQALLQAIVFEKERTFEQDPKYPIRLLVDIAIKALSPAINDPTTAVQTIDQIEDLLRRLGRCELEVGHVKDAEGNLRLVFAVPSWEDYLELGFEEIRQYGASSVQVMRRLRSALISVAGSLTSEARIDAVRRFLKHLDSTIEQSSLDMEDRTLALQEDRQGLGLSRKRPDPKNLTICAEADHASKPRYTAI